MTPLHHCTTLAHETDGNVLAALIVRTHVHHERAHHWFAGLKKDRFATCPITQGTLLRVHMRLSVEGSAAAAWEALRAVSAHPGHEWWDDSLDYLDVPHRNLQGHKQVTDAWLAELARRRGGWVATLDSGFATLHADVAVLLPRLGWKLAPRNAVKRSSGTQGRGVGGWAEAPSLRGVSGR